ncbi:MAG: hypothetical protein GY765_29895, partial [bacterium]|nr:hypothetical protein [bacterium]
MLKKITLLRKSWLMIATNALVFIVIGFFIYTNLNDVNAIWNRYKGDVVLRETYLMEMKSEFGYGGFIHNFKNYVLRKDKKYVTRFEENSKKLNEAINSF